MATNFRFDPFTKDTEDVQRYTDLYNQSPYALATSLFRQSGYRPSSSYRGFLSNFVPLVETLNLINQGAQGVANTSSLSGVNRFGGFLENAMNPNSPMGGDMVGRALGQLRGLANRPTPEAGTPDATFLGNDQALYDMARTVLQARMGDRAAGLFFGPDTFAELLGAWTDREPATKTNFLDLMRDKGYL